MMRWLLKCWINLIGIRFYEGFTEPRNLDNTKTVFVMVNGDKVEFRFYRETYTDHLYRNGSFRKAETQAFLIKAMFHPSLGVKTLKFNESRYLFRATVLRWFTDRVVADVILEIYLRFLQHHFETT